MSPPGNTSSAQVLENQADSNIHAQKNLDSESCLPVISKLFLPRCRHQEGHQCQFLHLAFLLPGGSEEEDFSAGRNEVVHTRDSVTQPEG